jgi:hypothetical protein
MRKLFLKLSFLLLVTSSFSLDVDSLCVGFGLGALTNVGKYKVQKNLALVSLYFVFAQDGKDFATVCGGHVLGGVVSSAIEAFKKYQVNVEKHKKFKVVQ